MKYAKIPIPVEAEQWFEGSEDDAVFEIKPCDHEAPCPGGFFVKTPSGDAPIKDGDYLAIDVKGFKYPIDQEIFEDTYVVVPDPLVEYLKNPNIARAILVEGMMTFKRNVGL